MKTDVRLEDYDFDLPKELIAQEPASKRHGSRLLVFDRSTGEITDALFKDIAKYLKPKTTLTVNNSKVEQCRLLFGSKEIFVLKAFNNTSVEALVRPGRAFKVGKTVELSSTLSAEVVSVTDDGHRVLEFSKPLDDVEIVSNQHVPLPPYIEQNDQLRERYQTVFAKPLGSKAAPTAGLHFSDELLDEIKKNHQFAEVTLHVGLGTFAPIEQKDIEKASLHSEDFEIIKAEQQKLEDAKHITAVGTTTLRTLESAFSSDHKVDKTSGSTNIFIQPGYQFKAVDSLITNFHLPKSSLLILISAFMGHENMKKVYKHAIKNEYRFYSFGDAMLLI